MPHLTIGLDDVRGPIIKLFVGVSSPRVVALQAANLPVPPPIIVDFLVDTGASCTAIDAATIAPLGISPTGDILVSTPTTGGQPETRLQYDVALMMYHEDNSRMFGVHPVIATDFSQQNIGGLLGRDVLEKCLLVYDGANRHFCLAF